jgi:hypothetical protein
MVEAGPSTNSISGRARQPAWPAWMTTCRSLVTVPILQGKMDLGRSSFSPPAVMDATRAQFPWRYGESISLGETHGPSSQP